ncbi:MAG TPA: DNA repair protein RecO [Candidatus Andersenbacteria bacterium]|nr:DNA repair protein RecO [Candidatus Andersenbacteria bacterium]
MPVSRMVSALVFSRKNIQEADRLVTFFTREEGLIRVIAKGVRKIPSSRGGHLEPCTRISAIINESKSRQTGGQAGIYVSNVETIEYFHELRNDADAFARACEQVKLFHRLFDLHQPVPELFDALIDAWRIYPSLSQEKRIVLDASIALVIVQHAGVLPDMRSWNIDAVQDTNDKSNRVIKYLAEHPEHAPRIVLSGDQAMQLQRSMKNLLMRTLADASVVYS